MAKMISVFGSKVDQVEIDNVAACMRSQWMGFGGKVKEFEDKYAQRFGLENFAMVDSGSNALYMAIALLKLPKGSEIILPSFTWVACAQAILMNGHRPVFCDVEINSMNVTRETIEPHITMDTKAIMIVHYAGKPVDMDPVLELGLPVIEDAAHAVDSYYRGKVCGSIGDVGIYSYDAVKNLTVGEGGGITAQKKELIDRAKYLRYCGIGKSGFDAAASNSSGRWWEYQINEPFIKMLPTSLAANIGLGQLTKIDELQAYRKKIWGIYQKEFSSVSWITRPVEAETDEQHSYFSYSVRVPKRDQFAKFLFDKNIYTTLRYHPLHLNALYQSDKKLPDTEQLNEDCLSIPLHPNLTMGDVEYVIETIKSFEKQL